MSIITATPSLMDPLHAPNLDTIRTHQKAIAPWILTTPVWQLQTPARRHLVGDGALYFKMELWQHTGTFKARGAISHVMQLNEQQRQYGITAVSAGNHAIAASYAAHCFNTSAKVLMPKYASPSRVKQCHDYGAEVIFTESMHELFDRATEIQQQEQRYFVHPFEGEQVVLGTATCGAEFADQAPELDAVIVAVGGGGLIAGVAAAIKQIQPNCKVYGAEPIGANTMTQSFLRGAPQKADSLETIADSLSAPHATPYSYSICQQWVDGLVNISDHEMVQAMRFAFDELKLALEPAAAIAVAALMGPLKHQLRDQRVGLLMCGTNTDPQTLCQLLNLPATPVSPT